MACRRRNPKCSVNSYIHAVNCIFCTFLLRYSLEIFRQYVLQYKIFTETKLKSLVDRVKFL